MSVIPAQRTENRQALGIAAVTGASVLWGTTGTAATFAPDVSALAIGAVAMGFGGLLQAIIALRQLQLDKALLIQQWPLVLLGSIAVMIYPLAFYTSMALAGVTIGTVVTIGTAPLFSALCERFIDGKKLNTQWMIACIPGIFGIILLSFYGGGHSETDIVTATGNVTTGIIFGLAGGLTYALYTWVAHRLICVNISARAAMGAIFGLGGLLLMPVLMITGGALLHSWNNFAVGAYMALIPMFAGYILFGYGLARISATMATTITLIEPVIAAIFAVLIVGERLTMTGWFGAFLVVLCLFILSAPRPKRR